MVGDSDPTKLFVKTVASSTQSMECCSSTMMGVAHNCRSEKIDAYMLCWSASIGHTRTWMEREVAYPDQELTFLK